MDDGAAYYLLGYYLDRKKDKTGWHDLNVKVNRPGVEVRSRRGFVVRDTEDKHDLEKELELALRSPLDYTGIPIMGRWQADSSSGTKHKCPFVLVLPPGAAFIDKNDANHMDLEFLVRVVAPDGTIATHTGQEMEGHLPEAVAQKVREQGVRYESTLELAPGDYTVHLVVRDKLTRRMGSVSTPLTVTGSPGTPTN